MQLYVKVPKVTQSYEKLCKVTILKVIYLWFRNRLTVKKKNMVNLAKLYWYTRQGIFVCIRHTVKKSTKNCLGPFQMRVNQKLIKNRSGNASIMHFFVEQNLLSLIIPAEKR